MNTPNNVWFAKVDGCYAVCIFAVIADSKIGVLDALVSVGHISDYSPTPNVNDTYTAIVSKGILIADVAGGFDDWDGVDKPRTIDVEIFQQTAIVQTLINYME